MDEFALTTMLSMPGPCAPVAPVAPVGPALPVAPVAPVGPDGPEGPVAPDRPVAPVAPTVPWQSSAFHCESPLTSSVTSFTPLPFVSQQLTPGKPCGPFAEVFAYNAYGTDQSCV